MCLHADVGISPMTSARVHLSHNIAAHDMAHSHSSIESVSVGFLHALMDTLSDESKNLALGFCSFVLTHTIRISLVKFSFNYPELHTRIKTSTMQSQEAIEQDIPCFPEVIDQNSCSGY